MRDALALAVEVQRVDRFHRQLRTRHLEPRHPRRCRRIGALDVEALGIGAEAVRIEHRLEVGKAVIDAGTRIHALEDRLVAAVGHHPAGELHECFVHVVIGDRGTDAVDMRLCHSVLLCASTLGVRS